MRCDAGVMKTLHECGTNVIYTSYILPGTNTLHIHDRSLPMSP